MNLIGAGTRGTSSLSLPLGSTLWSFPDREDGLGLGACTALEDALILASC